MRVLPKTIVLRLTRAALNAVPDASFGDGKDYINTHQCLICQAMKRKFPNITSISVVPGRVSIEGTLKYNYDAHWSAQPFGPTTEDRLVAAHDHPDEFKPFSIILTRE